MKEIKIGDRVRDISVTRRYGTITSVNHYGDPDCLVVRFDDDEEGVCYVKDLEIFPDPKTAFLTELSELLRKYDASIRVKICGFEKFKPHLYFRIGNELFYPPIQKHLTPDNIFNYEKE